MIWWKEFEEIDRTKENLLKSSIKDPPIMELKKLLDHLKYAILGKGSKLPIIVASNPKLDQKEKLLEVLNEHKRVIARKISDINGISPSFYTHKILMEENFKPVI